MAIYCSFCKQSQHDLNVYLKPDICAIEIQCCPKPIELQSWSCYSVAPGSGNKTPINFYMTLAFVRLRFA